MDLRQVGALMLLLVTLQSNLLTQAVVWRTMRRQPHRRWWVRPVNRPRRGQGSYDNLVRELFATDHEEFFTIYRMWPAQFQLLVELLHPTLKKSSIRTALPSALRVAVTLSFLSQGTSPNLTHVDFRIGRSTVFAEIHETCRAIVSILAPSVLKMPGKDGWKQIADNFMTSWQFPNCLGAIDGKHMRIQCPPNSGSKYHNYKGFFSMMLLATCDANYKFTWVDIGQFGSMGDRGVWANTDFAADLQGGVMDLPDPRPLPGMNMPFPYAFIGNEAFPLGTHMMRPYPRKELTDEHRIFNYRLSRARRTFENACGILTDRWQILNKPLRMKEENAESLFHALVCLHNFIMIGEKAKAPNDRQYCPPTMVDHEGADGTVSAGEWRRNVAPYFKNVGRLGGNRSNETAYGLRDYLRNYVDSNVGYEQCPWQAEYALRGHNPFNV